MKQFYQCCECEHVFAEDDMASGTTGVELNGAYERCGACPECGGIELEEVGICGECGEPIQDKGGDDYLCDRCLGTHTNFDEVYNYSITEQKAVIEINSLLAHLFSADDIEAMLLKEARERWDDEWVRSLFKMQKSLEDFISDAESEFCEYVLKEDKNAETV